MKKKRNRQNLWYGSMPNFLLKMKLLSFLIFVSVATVTANSYSQQTKFNMNFENVSVRKVFQQIEENSEFILLYSEKSVDVERKVNIEIINQTVDKILDQVFMGTKNYYEISDRQIAIMEKGSQEKPFFMSKTSEADQQKSVSGKVSDSTGAPLPGVSVVLKGTTTGVISDGDGKYSLARVPENSILQFSFVGMKSLEIKVGNLTSINVVLEDETIGIEEVVAVGYGSQKRSDITGSVTSVKVNDIQAAQINAVDKFLQGRASGVDVVAGNGAPGAAMNVKIRGTGTLSGNSEPLYVVDGVLISTASQEVNKANTNGNYTQESQNGLTAINPQDIESIEILKDASATAVYGSRGANGVVLITTKRGKTEKGQITFSLNTNVSTLSKKIPILEGTEFAVYSNELSKSLGLTPIYPQTVQGLDSLKTVDWQDYSTRTAVSQIYRLTFSGKTEKTNYYIAAGYADNQGIINNTWLKTGDIRVNLEQQINTKLKITSNTGITFSKNNWTQGTVAIGGGNASMVRSMLRKSPILGYESEDGAQDLYTNSESPQTWFEQFEDKSKELRLISSLNFDYKISKVFSYRLALGGDVRNKTRQQYWGPDLLFGSNNGKATYSALDYLAYSIDNLLLINKNFESGHKLNGTVGVTYDSNIIQNSSTSSENFFTQILMSDGITLGQTYYPFNLSKSSISILSAIARATYIYKDKYLLTLTGRIDGSSKFAPDSKYGFFPAVALAWRADQEEFIKRLDVFTNLKLRLGWGQTGVQSIAAYQTQALYNMLQSPNASDGVNIGQVASRIANQNLTWETSEQLNAGVDMGFWKNRITANIDVYEKTSVDLLQNLPIAPSSGFTSVAINLGTIENKGVEFGINAIVMDKAIRWEIGAQIASNRNQLKELGLPVNKWGTLMMSAYTGGNISTGDQLKVPANIFAEGQPVGMFWGLKSNGIYQSTDTENLTYKGAKTIPGDIKYIDQDGNSIIDAGDYTFIGNPNPDFTYGFNTSLSYKNLRLDLMMNGVQGRDICNANLVFEEYSGNSVSAAGANNIRKDAYFNAWRVDSPTNYYPRIGYAAPIDLSDRFIEDGSFLRLSNVTLSYKVPLKSVKMISNLDVFVSGSNLLLITDYKGFDPEVNSFTSDGTRIGIDWNSYPGSKSISFGIKVGF